MERLMERISVISLIVIVWLMLIVPKGNATAEGEALLVFKGQLHDPEKALSSWESNDPVGPDPCDGWDYIDCDTNRSVNRITLIGSSLSGHLVKELGMLTNLRDMTISNTTIDGSIPDELGSLVNLVRLNLGNNNFSGIVPCTFGRLNKLTLLNLENNPKLRGCIPNQLVNVRSYLSNSSVKSDSCNC